MKTNTKTMIGILAIALSSISMAEAGQKHHDRDNDRIDDGGHSRQYAKPHQQRQFRGNGHRKAWKSARRHRAIRHEIRRELRHERQQRRFNRHMRKYIRAHRRYSDRNYGWRYERRHFKRHHRHNDYGRFERSNYYSAPAYSSRVVISNHGHSGDVLPVLAGGLIGSAIASDASNGDPSAALGGAVFGAIVGSAIAQH